MPRTHDEPPPHSNANPAAREIAVLMAYWMMRQDDEGALSLTDFLKLAKGGRA